MMAAESEPRLVNSLIRDLEDAGLHGSFLVRDLATGREIGIGPDVAYPIASLVKVALAVAVLERIRRGEIDGAAMTDVRPVRAASPAVPGLSQFRHPARVAVADLLYLSLAISDNAASDALFELVAPVQVTETLRGFGIEGIVVRHTMRELTETPSERFGPENVHLAHALAIGTRTAGLDSTVTQLDVARANVGSARAYVDLLEALWSTAPSAIPNEVAEGVRSLMHANVLRQRLGPDFTSDSSTWASKTGTLLNLRHEVGVVEHEDGDVLAVAALTASRVPAASQPAAEALMGRVARALHDFLRD